MSESKLNVYANDQLLIIDWMFSDSIPDGMLLTLNDKAVPKPIQGMVISEKSRYLLVALIPEISELTKAKIEIRAKDASLIDSYVSKGKLKPLTEKDLQQFSPEALVKVLRGLLRKVPLTFKGIKNEILSNLCAQFATSLTSWKVSKEIYIQVPCHLSGKQEAGEREVLIWRLIEGSADVYEKLVAFWQEDICHVFLPESFIVESESSVYVIEDLDSFAIPFKLTNSKKLPKGISLEDSLMLKGAALTKPLKSFINRTEKKKPSPKKQVAKLKA